uniref:26S proteasome non-ATPase regulatory subunit 8 n=1 Tax=Sinocyclocheilus anshuiensis TaxID=1608454 RepID=A0A671KUG8_9TELE
MQHFGYLFSLNGDARLGCCSFSKKRCRHCTLKISLIEPIGIKSHILRICHVSFKFAKHCVVVIFIIIFKISLLELNFLPTTGTKLTKQQLILARDVLEIGALWSILKKDIPSFERYMAQLKCYYFDYKDELPESAYRHQLLGLNLLFLLSQNRVSEFHTELERLSAKVIQTNVYIRHPVSLEQYLMEGSYNKVFLSYTFFIDILLDTIRDEIAGCIEKAYEQIQFSEATRVLFFSSLKKMTEYAKKRGWTQSPDGHYSFSTQHQKTEEVTIPSTELAQQVIEYARQLEMIV